MWRGLKFSKERIIRYTGENILYECNRTFRTRVQTISWQWGRVKLPKDPLSYSLSLATLIGTFPTSTEKILIPSAKEYVIDNQGLREEITKEMGHLFMIGPQCCLFEVIFEQEVLAVLKSIWQALVAISIICM